MKLDTSRLWRPFWKMKKNHFWPGILKEDDAVELSNSILSFVFSTVLRFSKCSRFSKRPPWRQVLVKLLKIKTRTTRPGWDYFRKVSSKSAQYFRQTALGRQTDTQTERQTHTQTPPVFSPETITIHLVNEMTKCKNTWMPTTVLPPSAHSFSIVA